MAQGRMINILVVPGSKPEALQYLLIAKELLGRGITMHIAASRKHVYEFVRQQGWAHAILMEIKEPDASGKPDLKACIGKYTGPAGKGRPIIPMRFRRWRSGAYRLIRYAVSLAYGGLVKRYGASRTLTPGSNCTK
jgi:hypothetical protein